MNQICRFTDHNGVLRVLQICDTVNNGQPPKRIERNVWVLCDKERCTLNRRVQR